MTGDHSEVDVSLALQGRQVCLVIATTTGGTGSHVRSLVERLVDVDVSATVLGPRVTEDLFGFSALGATFVPIEISASQRPVDALRARELWPYLHQADMVHAHGLRAAFLASLGIGRHPAPFVVTLHNAVLTKGPRAMVLTQAERLVAHRATVVLCVSTDLVRRAASLGAADVRLAPVGASRLPKSARTRESVRAELGVPDSRPLILAVSRLAHQKGVDVLIKAAERWQSREIKPALVIAGDGPDERTLREQADETGIDVQFLGRRSDVPDLLAAADVVVLASRWEGSPLSAHEALQAGRPLVATAVGGVPDLVTGKGSPAALLVPSEDESALARAVCEVLDSPRLAESLAQAGPLRAQEWPDAHRSIDYLLGIYAELMGARD